MPTPKNKPEYYVPKEGVWVMKVARPFRAVAEWCGGDIVTSGNSGKFSYIRIDTSRDVFRAYEGALIVQSQNPVSGKSDYYVIHEPFVDSFFKKHRKAEDHERP